LKKIPEAENLMKKVLIVDDALFMRYLIRNLLERHEYEIVGEAENGYEAIEKYKELKPDIVTMDITIPGINGVNAIKIIKSFDENAKIIVISALGYASVISSAILAGACDFIVKPFQTENFLKVINRLK
jgi:two-component system chemotaxis response regulator CheY